MDIVTHGYWIRHGDDIKCSNCEALINDTDLWWAMGDLFPAKYCPNCGAQMEEDIKDEHLSSL